MSFALLHNMNPEAHNVECFNEQEKAEQNAVKTSEENLNQHLILTCNDISAVSKLNFKLSSLILTFTLHIPEEVKKTPYTFICLFLVLVLHSKLEQNHDWQMIKNLHLEWLFSFRSLRWWVHTVYIVWQTLCNLKIMSLQLYHKRTTDEQKKLWSYKLSNWIVSDVLK